VFRYSFIALVASSTSEASADFAADEFKTFVAGAPNLLLSSDAIVETLTLRNRVAIEIHTASFRLAVLAAPAAAQTPPDQTTATLSVTTSNIPLIAAIVGIVTGNHHHRR
jgi:hypothetical protein